MLSDEQKKRIEQLNSLGVKFNFGSMYFEKKWFVDGKQVAISAIHTTDVQFYNDKDWQKAIKEIETADEKYGK